MVWVAMAGISFQVLGLGLAINGVGNTYKEALDRNLWADLWGDFHRWIRTKILRRPQPHVMKRGTATVIGGGSVSVFAEVRPSKPAEDAGPEERIAYLMRFVEILSNETAAVRNHGDAVTRDAEARVGKRIDEVSSRLEDAGQRLMTIRKAVLGSEGTGLRQAALGLSITLLGVAMTAAGLPW